MADIVLRTETSGARPTFEHVEVRRRRAIQSPEEEPQRRHRQVNERAVRTFRLTWDETDEAQVEFIVTAWAASRGGVLAMDYTPVGAVDANKVDVCFVEGTLSIDRVAPAAWDMEIEVEEQL